MIYRSTANLSPRDQLANRNRSDATMSTVRLTARETELLQHLARGCTYIQVGDRLGMSCTRREPREERVPQAQRPLAARRRLARDRAAPAG
jgi:FixJ family two-component response regulator